MPPIDKLLSQYSEPVRSWPGEEWQDEEARANYAAANPRPPQQLRPDERYRGAVLPFRETTDGRHEWAVPGLLQDVFDSARAVRDTSGLGLGPALPPSQMRQEEFDQVLGHGMAGAMTGVTGGLARAAVSPRLATGEMELGAGGGRRPGLPMDQASRTARMEEQGWDPGWYHGGNRIDRFVEKGKIDPNRASSGPMPFFTDDPAIASNYAKGKPDTSMPDDGDVSRYFTVSPKELGRTRERTPYTVEQTWYSLAPEQRADILAKAKRVGYENPDQATGPYTLHPEGVEATLSSDQFDYLMKTSARGNPLKALRELWHDGGELVGSESDMATIWRLAGYPHKISETTAPWTEHPGVFPAALRMRNPLVTSDFDSIRDTVVPALKEAFKRDRTRKTEFGADAWDKTSRFTPREWVEQLERDLAEGKEGYVWTSIPDKVTDALKSLGYDGIMDTGGKGDGIGHRVAIPFRPDQVRATYAAAFDPEKLGSPDLLASHRLPLPPLTGDDERQSSLEDILSSYGKEQ